LKKVGAPAEDLNRGRRGSAVFEGAKGRRGGTFIGLVRGYQLDIGSMNLYGERIVGKGPPWLVPGHGRPFRPRLTSRERAGAIKGENLEEWGRRRGTVVQERGGVAGSGLGKIEKDWDRQGWAEAEKCAVLSGGRHGL